MAKKAQACTDAVPQSFRLSSCLCALQDYTGLGNELGRQVLRTRRSFTATVLSADGECSASALTRVSQLQDANA